MKFENGEHKNHKDGGYLGFNYEVIPELLEKRKREQSEFEEREQQKRKMLEKAEKSGKLCIKGRIENSN